MAKKQKPEPQDLPAIEGPGVGRVVIKEIEKVAKRFVASKEELDELKDSHDALKIELAALMEQHADELGRDGEGVIRYYHADVCVEVAPGKKKITVTSKGDLEDPDNETN